MESVKNNRVNINIVSHEKIYINPDMPIETETDKNNNRLKSLKDERSEHGEQGGISTEDITASTSDETVDRVEAVSGGVEEEVTGEETKE